MGSGYYSDTDYRSFAAPLATKSRQEVFQKRAIHSAFDPKGIALRESCDSEDHPNSRAIILGLDVTGSMGIIAENMAKEQLGTLVQGILDRQPFADPQIMIMGIGDAYCDEAPLQVSQFESDIRIAQQLVDIYLEGRGGGNDSESYDLPWYFAGERTKIDCFDKRGEKGYLITIGDEMPPAGLHEHHLKEIFGTGFESGSRPEQSLKKAQERYEVFHIIVEQGNYARGNLSRVKPAWRALIGKRAVLLDQYTHLPEVVLSLLQVAEGDEPEEVIASWQSPDIQRSVRHALFD